MKPGFFKTLIGTVLIVSIILIIGFVLLADTIMGPSYQVDIKGTVHNDFLGGLSFTYTGYTIKQDSYTKLGFLDTDEIIGIVTLYSNDGTMFTAQKSIGGLSLLWEDKELIVSVRHVPVGDYYGEFQIYQIHYGNFGLFEESRSELFSVKLENIKV